MRGAGWRGEDRIAAFYPDKDPKKLKKEDIMGFCWISIYKKYDRD